MIKKQEVHMRTKMVEEMRKCPITIKRSVAQFGMNLMND